MMYLPSRLSRSSCTQVSLSAPTEQKRRSLWREMSRLPPLAGGRGQRRLPRSWDRAPTPLQLGLRRFQLAVGQQHLADDEVSGRLLRRGAGRQSCSSIALGGGEIAIAQAVARPIEKNAGERALRERRRWAEVEGVRTTRDPGATGARARRAPSPTGAGAAAVRAPPVGGLGAAPGGGGNGGDGAAIGGRAGRGRSAPRVRRWVSGGTDKGPPPRAGPRATPPA